MNARWLLLTTNIRATYWQGRLEELTFAVDPATQRQSRLSSPGLTASVIRSAQQDGTIQAAELVCHQLAQAMVKMQRERERDPTTSDQFTVSLPFAWLLPVS
jgi:hypothetical protein